MLDYIEFESVPDNENCVQLGKTEDFLRMNTIECRVLINQLSRMFGTCDNAIIKRKTNYHDFGTYYSVCVYYHDDNEQECEYAYKFDENFPKTWDNEAKKELQELGYKLCQ